MPKKAKFGFGSSINVEQALKDGKINARDIVFLDENTDNPKVGWITSDGKIVTANADLSSIKAELKTKINAEDVDKKVEAAVKSEVESVITSIEQPIEKVRFQIAGVPNGTLIDYRDKEIRVLCPENTQWTKQTVGVGGDVNSYYMTLKVYSPNDASVGYIEHLGDQIDKEILTDFYTDEYGRRYQSTWLALAKYDETTGMWSYYGKDSTENHYIGYDYQIDWYNENNVMIGSDCVRINLSNENCHSVIEPYYVGKIMADLDAKIAEVGSAYEIIEF